MLVSRQLPLPQARLAALADGESIYGTEDGGADSALITNDAAAPALVLSWSGRPTVVAGRLGLASGVNGGLFLPRYASGSLAGITAKAEGLTVWNDTTHLPNFWNGTTWIAMPDPGAGTAYTVSTKTTTCTAVAGDVLLCDASGGAFTVTLPAAATVSGSSISVKKTDASANAVTVDGNASETIDGAATLALSTQYEAVTLWSDGTNWWVF